MDGNLVSVIGLELVGDCYEQNDFYANVLWRLPIDFSSTVQLVIFSPL